MTDEVPNTDRFRNVSGHPEDLTGGKMVPTGEFVDLTEEEQKDEFNAAKLAEGFIKVPAEEPDDEPGTTREELLARAKELDIKGRTTMRDDQLQTAIITAEEKLKSKEGDG